MDYTNHFKLADRPFKNTYDRKYYYRSLAADVIFKALGSEDDLPLIHLKARPKVGLTSLLRYLPGEFRLNFRVALIFNPHLTLSEILRQCLSDFGQGHKFDNKTLEESLLGFYQSTVNEFLADGFRVLLVVDNAGELSPDTLGEFYSLMELQVEWRGRVLLLLGGSSETPWPAMSGYSYKIRELVLPPLTEAETEGYLTHRLKAAGGNFCFNRGALSEIGAYGLGLPEFINQLADRSLIAAWSKGLEVVGFDQVKAAVSSLESPARNFGGEAGKSNICESGISRKTLPPRLKPLALLILVIVVLGFGIYSLRPVAPAVEIVQEVVVFDDPPSDAVPAGKSLADDAPSLPAPPPQLLALPQGTLTLVVDQDHQVGRLWQGGARGIGLKAEVAVPNFDSMGLFLFGRPRGSDPLIFQYPPSHDLPKEQARIIWPRVVNLLPQNIIPVMVASGRDYQRPQDFDAKRQILKNIKIWVRSQQYRFPDTMADLYASYFEFFELGQAGRTVEQEKFRQALSSEALTSGEVDLAISEPLIMQDPVRDNLFWAMFNLKYTSKLRNDMGIRVLIFEKSTLKSQWLIVAELWLPEKSLKEN